MKVNTFAAILSFALAGLMAFFLSFYVSGENKWLVGIGSFLTIAISLAGTVSLSFYYDRTTTLARVTSGVFLAIFLTCQIVFTAINNFLLPTYVLVMGGLAILQVLMVYGIALSKH